MVDKNGAKLNIGDWVYIPYFPVPCCIDAFYDKSVHITSDLLGTLIESGRVIKITQDEIMIWRLSQ
jgi:hypothetical protein